MYEWESITDTLMRMRIFQGWLVKEELPIHEKIWEHETLTSGYNWRTTMTYIPDPSHKWQLKEQL